ncbi:MAG: NmrA family NAD(P)-binding protein, partial [Lewinella sp.]|nr:NmrA family NAD(P)-binding protein [Lewinella sp.]
MILVIGATGWLGREICRQLTEKDLPVRAMVRPISEPAKVAELKNMGAIPVVGDLRDPVTFMSVLEGVDTVIATVSSMPFSYVPGDNDMQRVDEAGMIRFIESAQQAGVRHFIYTSFSGDFGLDFPLAHAKRSVEGHLHQSGMTYTILRPSCFMEAWLTPAVGFDVANRQVTIYGDGTQKVSY